MPTPRSSATSGPGQGQLEQIWSSTGNPNAFDIPDGIALDPHGNLYVMDSGNDRVQKFDDRGDFITMWGTKGGGDGQFECTEGLSEGDFTRAICMIAVDGEGNVFVTDRGNSRVEKFDANGTFLAKWGGLGTDDGQFDHPFGVAADRQGNVHVGDVGNGRIQKFDGNGSFLGKWGSRGDKDGQFSENLADLVIDDQGDIYVTDRTNGLQKFDSLGRFLRRQALCGESGQAPSATGIALDSPGNLYVFDMAAFRLCKYDGSGRLLADWGGPGSGEAGAFTYVGGIAVDRNGDIYVAELFVGRVSKYRQP